MAVKLDESDVKTLEIMQKNIEELHERLGVLEHQYQKRRDELIKGVDSAIERRYEFMQMLAEKYSLDSDIRWEFNLKDGSFYSVDDLSKNKGDKE